MEVRVGGQDRKSKVRKVEEGRKSAGSSLVLEGRGFDGKVAGKKEDKGRNKSTRHEDVRKEADPVAAIKKQEQHNFQFIPMFKSCIQDRKWANTGIVGTVSTGESALAIQ